MSNAQYEDHPNQKPDTETQAGDQSGNWRQSVSGFFHDLFFGSYAANIITSIAFVLVGPLIGLTMNSKKAILIGGGIGLTILVWIVIIAAVRRISSEADSSAEPPAINEPAMNQPIQNNNITSTGQSGGFTGINTGTVHFEPPLKALKERLIDCLNEIDPTIVSSLGAEPKTIHIARMQQPKLAALKEIAKEQGASDFIEILPPNQAIGSQPGKGEVFEIGPQGTTVSGMFTLRPALRK